LPGTLSSPKIGNGDIGTSPLYACPALGGHISRVPAGDGQHVQHGRSRCDGRSALARDRWPRSRARPDFRGNFGVAAGVRAVPALCARPEVSHLGAVPIRGPAFTVHIPWGEAFARAVWPAAEVNRDYLFMVVAVLGTTISPYLFFWQASQEVEQMKQNRPRRPLKERSCHGCQSVIEATMRSSSNVSLYRIAHCNLLRSELCLPHSNRPTIGPRPSSNRPRSAQNRLLGGQSAPLTPRTTLKNCSHCRINLRRFGAYPRTVPRLQFADLAPRERPLGLSPLDVGSRAPQSVFQSANGVLHFALELISFAFAFELAVAGYLSDNFLQFAPGLLSRALDAIFVHHNGLQYFERSRIIDGRNRYGTEISDHYYTDTVWPSAYVPRHTGRVHDWRLK
jgi:Natural resistance-associated macrophage protein-like